MTAPWQCSQLYNFTALCFLCGEKVISPWSMRQGCSLIAIQMRPLCPWKELQHTIKFSFFYSCDWYNMYLATLEVQALSRFYALLWKSLVVKQEFVFFFITPALTCPCV